jgi:hypothetical protein
VGDSEYELSFQPLIVRSPIPFIDKDLFTMRAIHRLAAAAAFVSLAALAAFPIAASAAPANPQATYYPYPTRYSESGVPEYGLVGQGVWQVAGIVNMGEPSMRIVYDDTVPGARERASGAYYQLSGQMYQLSQPGTTAGLREVGYSAHYDGVQFQVWGNNPYIDSQVTRDMAEAGLPLFRA